MGHISIKSFHRVISHRTDWQARMMITISIQVDFINIIIIMVQNLNKYFSPATQALNSLTFGCMIDGTRATTILADLSTCMPMQQRAKTCHLTTSVNRLAATGNANCSVCENVSLCKSLGAAQGYQNHSALH